MRGKKYIRRDPLHQQVADALRGQITAKYTPGLKLESETNLAKRFSVSVVTIREALSALAQEGLVQREHGRGTFVADWRSSQSIGILFAQDIALQQNSDFVLRVAQELRQILEEANCETRLYMIPAASGGAAADVSCPVLTRDVEENQLAAVAAINVVASPHWLAPLQQQNIPVVGSRKGFTYCVRHDHQRMISDGVKYLVKRGCKKIVLMSWDEYRSFTECFIRELQIAHLPVHQGWIRNNLLPKSLGVGWQEFREIWSAASDKPDGLLISDDQLCAGAVKAIEEVDVRIPEELIIISHANKGREIQTNFPMPRMECDPDEFASAVAEMLINLKDTKPMGSPIVSLGFNWVDDNEPTLSHTSESSVNNCKVES